MRLHTYMPSDYCCKALSVAIRCPTTSATEAGPLLLELSFD